MIARQSFKLHVPYTLDSFGGMFFRRCVATGHVYACAPAWLLNEFVEFMTNKKNMPPTCLDGSAWTSKELLRPGDRERLMLHERRLRKMRRTLKYIVNIRQSPAYSRPGSEMMPALLTRTSFLYDMKMERSIVPQEHFLIQGFPIFVVAPQEAGAARAAAAEARVRAVESQSSVERLMWSGDLTHAEMMHVTGNGMHLAAVGAVMLFCFSMMVPLPAHYQSAIAIMIMPSDDDDIGGVIMRPAVPGEDDQADDIE